MHYTERQVTFDNAGHTIHNTQVFSSDDQWVVFDSRNEENRIPETEFVKMVNTESGEIKTLYQTQNQSEYGPGVGAATFSTTDRRVLFIRGLLNCDRNNPYSFSRRTGVAIDIDRPLFPIYLDARDVAYPFTPGAHRGGSHAHTWSGDGKRISYTYNDEVINRLSQIDDDFQDLRTVGVMFPKQVTVSNDDGVENFSGQMFSVIVVKVTEMPKKGSDEINKAFDEGWIGKDGYVNHEGKHIKYAIAFQGNVIDTSGNQKTEVFVVDLPQELASEEKGALLEGAENSRMGIPSGVSQRRVTFTEKGILGPRHWLRTNAEGTLIAFLSEDTNGIIQVFGVNTNGGAVQQLTHAAQSIQGPFNFSPDGHSIAYFSGNAVWITDLRDDEEMRLSNVHKPNELTGAPVWSNNGKMLAYNKYVDGFVQIFLIDFIKSDAP